MTSCCGTSVGVLIHDSHGRLLMIERGWWPIGIAPVAGHVRDAHSTAAEALVAETREEVGLEVTQAELLWTGHLPNLCASPPSNPPGHHWWLYRASATGTLRPAEGETKGAAWYTPSEVQALAERTLSYARGEVTAEEFERAPGMEAVWIDLLSKVALITGDGNDKTLTLSTSGRGLHPAHIAIRDLYTTPPPEYWRGSP